MSGGGAARFEFRWLEKNMAAFAPRSFCWNSSRDFVESDDDFSEEDNYVPPSDDDETSSADCSDSSDEEVSVPDNNSGPSSSRAPALSSWTAYTDDLPDFPGVVFTVSDPGPQVGSSNLSSELEFFQLFFTDELIGEIVQETNQHAQEKISSMDSLAELSIWKSWEDTSVEELKAFLGVLMNMALNPKLHQGVFQPRNFEDAIFSRRVHSHTISADISDAARLSNSARSLTPADTRYQGEEHCEIHRHKMP